MCLRSHESSECVAVGGRARVSIFFLFKAVCFSFLSFLSFGDCGSAAGAPNSPCQTEGSSLKELTEPVARRLSANRARVCPSDVKRRPSHRRQEDGAWETQTQADSLTGSRVRREGLLRLRGAFMKARESDRAEQSREERSRGAEQGCGNSREQNVVHRVGVPPPPFSPSLAPLSRAAALSVSLLFLSLLINTFLPVITGTKTSSGSFSPS